MHPLQHLRLEEQMRDVQGGLYGFELETSKHIWSQVTVTYLVREHSPLRAGRQYPGTPESCQ